MDGLAFLIIGLEGLLFLATALVLVWLIARRIKQKREETFEKRDN